MNILFATGNEHKVSEIRKLLPQHITIQSLKDIAFEGELEEPFLTLEENAATKAAQLHQELGLNVFAEDSGLFVEALNGEPGVFSARYAGPNSTDQMNLEKLISSMKDETNRKAYFKTVIHLLLDNKSYEFLGICEGHINFSPKGNQGFGYDPIFIPTGFDQTFAELGIEIKNKISHRSKATELFLHFLLSQ